MSGIPSLMLPTPAEGLPVGKACGQVHPSVVDPEGDRTLHPAPYWITHGGRLEDPSEVLAPSEAHQSLESNPLTRLSNPTQLTSSRFVFPAGFEPATFGMSNRRSTTELRKQDGEGATLPLIGASQRFTKGYSVFPNQCSLGARTYAGMPSGTTTTRHYQTSNRCSSLRAP